MNLTKKQDMAIHIKKNEVRSIALFLSDTLLLRFVFWQIERKINNRINPIMQWVANRIVCLKSANIRYIQNPIKAITIGIFIQLIFNFIVL